LNGWVKIHRELLEKSIWKDSTDAQKVVLITILLLASHIENEWFWSGTRHIIKPGQFVTSIKSLAEKTGLTSQKIRTSLKKFESYGFLTSKATNKNRLITVVNWEKYQNSQTSLTDNLTNNQQTTNKQLTNKLTTIKKIKNEKNVEEGKEESIVSAEADAPAPTQKRFKPPSLKEVTAYYEEISYNDDPNIFVDYYTANGWKVSNSPMKDWKATVRNWKRRQKENKNSSSNPYLDMLKQGVEQ